ncbi:hypothetical protein B0H14DRAFT_2568749 [Mycena olivaceomarginata]|nr:hypothetical protein B0H14DRAFT_2568749 [Mycena olivaceomarginata]
MERVSSSVLQDADASQPTRETAELHGDFDNSRPELPERQDSAKGRMAFSGERPCVTIIFWNLVEPHPGYHPISGGVAIDGGHEGMPMGKASATDKLIGKAQKLVSKVTKKPEMHERGELRESGGKSAAAGDARAPHD